MVTSMFVLFHYPPLLDPTLMKTLMPAVVMAIIMMAMMVTYSQLETRPPHPWTGQAAKPTEVRKPSGCWSDASSWNHYSPRLIWNWWNYTAVWRLASCCGEWPSWTRTTWTCAGSTATGWWSRVSYSNCLNGGFLQYIRCGDAKTYIPT